MQKHPKCRTCGKEHALGGCPEFIRVRDAKTVKVEPKATAKPESEQGVQLSRPEPIPQMIIGVDPASSKDFGAKVIGRVMEDGRIEILSRTHSKAQFNKAEYQRQYMADQRTIKRLGLNCTVAVYRAGKYGENK
jgi:hypothetical protein